VSIEYSSDHSSFSSSPYHINPSFAATFMSSQRRASHHPDQQPHSQPGRQVTITAAVEAAIDPINKVGSHQPFHRTKLATQGTLHLINRHDGSASDPYGNHLVGSQLISQANVL
jgi:hypothetical protein